MSFVT